LPGLNIAVRLWLCHSQALFFTQQKREAMFCHRWFMQWFYNVVGTALNYFYCMADSAFAE
jgi:hypothetical protein